MPYSDFVKVGDKEISVLDKLCLACDFIGQFTGRNDIAHVTVDFLRTYEWILFNECSGRRLYSVQDAMDPTANSPYDDDMEIELENYVKDVALGVVYFQDVRPCLDVLDKQRACSGRPYLRVKAVDEARDAIEIISAFTHKTPEQMLGDAFAIYESILSDQINGRAILSLRHTKKLFVTQLDFGRQIFDLDAARRYFDGR